jgi:NAD(P)H dehydrogenase (quinone)
VRLLLRRGHDVTALVHREDARSQELADAGAAIVVGDLLDLRDVSRATRDVDGVYLCYPIRPGLLDATANVAQAASEAGVTSVVNMSQISARPDADSNAARAHWVAERLLDRGGFLTAHLRPTFFAEWLNTFWRRNEDSGALTLPLGTGRHAPIASLDQAYVIAAILENPEPHDRRIYPLTGPVEMDHNGIAEALARTLGIPVRYEPIAIKTFTTLLLAKGFPEHLVQHLGSVALDYQNGIFASTNDFIETIGGREPMTVERYASANREAFAQTGLYAVEPAVA